MTGQSEFLTLHDLMLAHRPVQRAGLFQPLLTAVAPLLLVGDGRSAIGSRTPPLSSSLPPFVRPNPHDPLPPSITNQPYDPSHDLGISCFEPFDDPPPPPHPYDLASDSRYHLTPPTPPRPSPAPFAAVLPPQQQIPPPYITS